ncbi:MAG: NADP-dependent oxidoreductase [Acidimicrobiia bacterium]
MPMPATNRQLRLAKRPTGMIDESTFDLVEESIGELADGEYVVRITYLSIDPTQRVWIREEESYLPPVQIGEVMRSGAIGEVIESRAPDVPVGSLVTGLLGWQEHAVCGPETLANVVPPGLPLRQMMGVLGTTGITAYFGMLDVGQAKDGDTVVVSGAAGATGSVAAQIAKIQGGRVIGIAGGAEKCAWLRDECGLDATIDYKSEDVGTRLAELCPDGIDVVFENVGGEILDASLQHLAIGARVALCGAIATYNDVDQADPIHWYMNLVVKRARIEGFLVLDFLERFPEAVLQLATWVMEGKIAWRDTVVEGLENAPDALNMLFRGENLGKLLVQVGPDPSA